MGSAAKLNVFSCVCMCLLSLAFLVRYNGDILCSHDPGVFLLTACKALSHLIPCPFRLIGLSRSTQGLFHWYTLICSGSLALLPCYLCSCNSSPPAEITSYSYSNCFSYQHPTQKMNQGNSFSVVCCLSFLSFWSDDVTAAFCTFFLSFFATVV